MSGINYDELEKHSEEVKRRQRTFLAFDSVKSEDDFFQHLHINEIKSGKRKITLYALSVPIEYGEDFISTVYDDFLYKAPKNLRIDHVISFAHKLKNYQHLFFGECDEHRENRKHFVENLSTPSAQVFTSEAFELLKYDGCATPGLYEACYYITLQTESSLKRFVELSDKKS